VDTTIEQISNLPPTELTLVNDQYLEDFSNGIKKDPAKKENLWLSGSLSLSLKAKSIWISFVF
jgi:hypothetical protein